MNSSIGLETVSRIREYYTFDNSDIRNDVLYKNEVQANRLTAITMICATGVMLVFWIMNDCGMLGFDKDSFTAVVAVSGFLLLFPAFLCFQYRGRPKWIKNMLMFAMLVVVSLFYIIVSVSVLLLMPLVMVISTRYYSRTLTVGSILFTYLLFFIAVGVSALVDAKVDITTLDLSGMTVTINGSLDDVLMEAARAKYGDGYVVNVTVGQLLQDYFPNALFLGLFSIICVSITANGRKMLHEQADVAASTANMKTELKTATDIQSGLLPEGFPARDECTVCGTMIPAREVGGDIYDYYLIDDSHVCITVADVSGKGIPAALFMVIAKTLMKDNFSNQSPAEAMTRVNQILCSNNRVGLFVTAWVGVLDLDNNRLTFVNAGHNPPLIKRQGGSYEYLESDPGLALAVLDGFQYAQVEMPMYPGDRIFLYTDGVTEARDNVRGMYGEARLKEFLNTHTGDQPEALFRDLKEDVRIFSRGEEQFDDMTMLALYYNKSRETGNEKVFGAEESQLPYVIDYVCSGLEDAGCPVTDADMLKVSVEEIFTNIVHYAYLGRHGTVRIIRDITEASIMVKFVDSGIPFNPLIKEDPDISLDAEQRDIGGLGIYITKTYMDRMEYDYIGNQNVLTMWKKWAERR